MELERMEVVSPVSGRLDWQGREAESWRRKPVSFLPVMEILINGTSFITCPTELIKIRQQSSTAKIAPTTIGTVKHIIRQDGVSGLYRGFGSTAGRELAYGTYFFTVRSVSREIRSWPTLSPQYEGICRYFRNKRRRNDSPPPSSIHHSAYAAHRQKPDPSNADGLSPRHEHRVHHESLIEEAENELEELSWGELMIAGGCAGTASWLATFPLDTIKTRIQGMSLKTGEKMPSTLSVTRNIIRKEGWRCLFHGLTPTLIRYVLSDAANMPLTLICGAERFQPMP